MTNQEYETVKKGSKLYYPRIIEKFGYYEIHDVVMVAKYEDHCHVVDVKTKQAFMIENKNIDKQLYINREEALKYLRIMQDKKS